MSPQSDNQTATRLGAEYSHLSVGGSNFTPSSLAFTVTPPISSFAPPPPSLSVALQVPGFDAPPHVIQHHASSSTCTTTTYSSGTLASKPAFDVDVRISHKFTPTPVLVL